MREKDWLIIWPSYFSGNISSRMGRRLPPELCVPEPVCEDIERACRKLNYRIIVEKDAKHPAFWWKNSGRVKVFKGTKKKGEVLREIAPVLKVVYGTSAKKEKKAHTHRVKIKGSKKHRRK